MRKIIILFCISFLSTFLISQELEYVKNTAGFVSIQGELGEKVNPQSGIMFLYEVKGNDYYILDSIPVKSGKFLFKKQNFQTGVYRLAYNNETNALDIVINSKEGDKIILNINNSRIDKGYNVPGSIENKIKKQYSIKEESITQKIKSIRKTQKSRDQKLSEMKILEKELFDYGVSLNNQYPGTYFGMILSHMLSPLLNKKYQYFNDIDFTDECIIRSALLPTRIQKYFQTHGGWPNNPYGFHDAIDYIMDYAKLNDNVAEFCMYNMLDGFYNTGQTDKKGNAIWMMLCNYIMDEYIFGEGCGDDVEPSQLLKERANKFKNLQIGNVPPNFSVPDINGKNINLQNVCKQNQYTVLLFWASHCQHCMQELPGFANWYSQNKKNNNFEIIAISLDGNKTKWKDTVDNNNFNWRNVCQFKNNRGLVYKSPICLDYKIKKTPSIFVLNKNMQIVSKPKNTHQLRSFLLSNK